MSALESHLCLKSTLLLKLDSPGRTRAHSTRYSDNRKVNESV